MFYLIVFLVIILDQISKFLALTHLKYNQSEPMIKNIFHLTLIKNEGAVFGILPGQVLFFIVFSILVISGIIFLKHNIVLNRPLKLGLAFQLGGAVGNLIDRIRFGYVLDFFDFRIWPIFNLADIFIVVGGITIMWGFLCDRYFAR